jgi:hypothetical protein
MSDQEKGHGHHALTREAVHELFTSGRGEVGADGQVRIRGMTEDQYFAELDKAQEHADRIIGGDTWHDASSDPDAQRHHAMADPHKSGAQNVADTENFITGELESARAHQGTHKEEMAHLGAAAHALEDSYSEAHEFRGESVFQGDPTAPIESLNVFHPLGLHHGPGGISEGTHLPYLDHVPTGHGTGKTDAYGIAHNADGSVPLERGSDQAAGHATAEMLERYEDARTAADGEQRLHHAVDDFFQMDSHGVKVNAEYSDPSFQQQLRHRVEIDQAQEAAAQHAGEHAWHDAGDWGSQDEIYAHQAVEEAEQEGYEEA